MVFLKLITARPKDKALLKLNWTRFQIVKNKLIITNREVSFKMLIKISDNRKFSWLGRDKMFVRCDVPVVVMTARIMLSVVTVMHINIYYAVIVFIWPIMLSPASTAFQSRNHSIKIFKLSLRGFYQREAPLSLITDLCGCNGRLGVSGLSWYLDCHYISSQVSSSQVSSVCLASSLNLPRLVPTLQNIWRSRERSIKFTILNEQQKITICAPYIENMIYKYCLSISRGEWFIQLRLRAVRDVTLWIGLSERKQFCLAV